MKTLVGIYYSAKRVIPGLVAAVLALSLTACANPNPTKISSRELAKQIRLTLYKNGLYQDNHIRVEVFEKKIILSGTVQSASQANDVNTIASSFVDPSNIEDNLEIKYKKR